MSQAQPAEVVVDTGPYALIASDPHCL